MPYLPRKGVASDLPWLPWLLLTMLGCLGPLHQSCEMHANEELNNPPTITSLSFLCRLLCRSGMQKAGCRQSGSKRRSSSSRHAAVYRHTHSRKACQHSSGVSSWAVPIRNLPELQNGCKDCFGGAKTQNSSPATKSGVKLYQSGCIASPGAVNTEQALPLFAAICKQGLSEVCGALDSSNTQARARPPSQ